MWTRGLLRAPPLVGPAAPFFVTALRSPLCYPHPVARVEMLETHISWVFLAGDFAYKVKKPVNLGFLDFSTLALRRHYCEEEVRLNRRTAPGLYLDVVAIAGSPAAPGVDGAGKPFEYAVRMRRFAQDDRLDARAARGCLGDGDVDALAASIAAFHAAAVPLRRPAPGEELRYARDNFASLSGAAGLPAPELEALAQWTGREHAAVAGLMERRRAEGFVRECHGDLHLGNIAMLEGVPVPFDCIEFDEALRRIDVMADIAFTVMDLRHHGLEGLAARFLDAYLQHTGDYGGLGVLRFHAVYRAMVRAKIAAIRGARVDAQAHVRLASTLAQPPTARLTIMHGLAGSGKTTVSQRLLEAQGAVRIRSDVERKRLLGVGALCSAAAPPGEGIYTREQRRGVYERLEALARTVLVAGYPVIVDAAFLARSERERFRALAASLGCAFGIVACEAPEAVLRKRVAQRAARGGDASDAGVAVLASQLQEREPLDGAERALSAVDTSRG